MATLSTAEVLHIAKLARLAITEHEAATYAKELTSILTYVSQLQEVDTKNVEATAQVTGLTNVFRPDVKKESETPSDALLATSPLPIVARQIKTPSAHG
jgi:aspartyl-tRNA(Asn)/glutamyl-tRNA(Gln) amidotransferase subunit C